MATATVRRPDPATVIHWSQRAACIDTPHLHTADLRVGVIGGDSPHAQARHICLTHCPVIDDCRDDIADRTPRGVVQAGLVYADTRTARPRAARQQPPDPGCGPWCAHLRRDGR